MSKRVAPIKATEVTHPPRPGFVLVPCAGPAHDEDSEEATCKLCAPRWGWVELAWGPGVLDWPKDCPPEEVQALEEAVRSRDELLGVANQEEQPQPPTGTRTPKTIRAHAEQWEAYERAARGEGRSLNAWILRQLDWSAPKLSNQYNKTGKV